MIFRKFSQPLLNTTLSITWVGKSFTQQLIEPHLKFFIWFLGISFGSTATKPSVVSLCVQEESSNKPFICKISVIHFLPSLSQSLLIYFQNLIYDFVLWACLRWIAFYRRQLIIWEVDLQIVSTLKSACHTGRFLSFDDRLHQ